LEVALKSIVELSGQILAPLGNLAGVLAFIAGGAVLGLLIASLYALKVALIIVKNAAIFVYAVFRVLGEVVKGLTLGFKALGLAAKGSMKEAAKTAKEGLETIGGSMYKAGMDTHDFIQSLGSLNEKLAETKAGAADTMETGRSISDIKEAYEEVMKEAQHAASMDKLSNKEAIERYGTRLNMLAMEAQAIASVTKNMEDDNEARDLVWKAEEWIHAERKKMLADDVQQTIAAEELKLRARKIGIDQYIQSLQNLAGKSGIDKSQEKTISDSMKRGVSSWIQEEMQKLKDAYIVGQVSAGEYFTRVIGLTRRYAAWLENEAALQDQALRVTKEKFDQELKMRRQAIDLLKQQQELEQSAVESGLTRDVLEAVEKINAKRTSGALDASSAQSELNRLAKEEEDIQERIKDIQQQQTAVIAEELARSAREYYDALRASNKDEERRVAALSNSAMLIGLQRHNRVQEQEALKDIVSLDIQAAQARKAALESQLGIIRKTIQQRLQAEKEIDTGLWEIWGRQDKLLSDRLRRQIDDYKQAGVEKAKVEEWLRGETFKMQEDQWVRALDFLRDNGLATVEQLEKERDYWTKIAEIQPEINDQYITAYNRIRDINTALTDTKNITQDVLNKQQQLSGLREKAGEGPITLQEAYKIMSLEFELAGTKPPGLPPGATTDKRPGEPPEVTARPKTLQEVIDDTSKYLTKVFSQESPLSTSMTKLTGETENLANSTNNASKALDDLASRLRSGTSTTGSGSTHPTITVGDRPELLQGPVFARSVQGVFNRFQRAQGSITNTNTSSVVNNVNQMGRTQRGTLGVGSAGHGNVMIQGPVTLSIDGTQIAGKHKTGLESLLTDSGVFSKYLQPDIASPSSRARQGGP